MAKNLKIKLSVAVKHKGHSFDELEMKPLKPKHLEAMDEVPGEAAKINRLIAALCGVPVAIIHDLEPEDYAKCMAFASEALGKLHVTGDE